MDAELSSQLPTLLPVPQRTDLAMREIAERQAGAYARVVLHAVAVLGLLGSLGWSIS